MKSSSTTKSDSYLAQKQMDVLLTVGALSTSIAQGAKDYRKNHAGAYPCSVHTFTTKEELIAQLPALLKQGDNILVKASHAMEFPKVIEAITRNDTGIIDYLCCGHAKNYLSQKKIKIQSEILLIL